MSQPNAPRDYVRAEMPFVKSGNTQYLYLENKFAPISATTKELPPGIYNICWDTTTQQEVPISKPVNVDELFFLPVPAMESVIKDINSFWENEGKYRSYGSVYKRGILLYGPPGCGKSSVIMLLAKELIVKHKGVVFTPQDSDEVYMLFKLIPIIKDIEPNKRIIVVLEDIDSMMGATSSDNNTKILNFLDGGDSVDGVITIATTNYPEALQDRLFNRPSRFDRRYEIGKPNESVRRFYIVNKLKNGNISNDEIEFVVKKTEGFTIDHIKEYLLSVYVLGYSHEDAFADISNILMTRVLKNNKETVIGFDNKK